MSLRGLSRISWLFPHVLNFQSVISTMSLYVRFTTEKYSYFHMFFSDLILIAIEKLLMEGIFSLRQAQAVLHVLIYLH